MTLIHKQYLLTNSLCWSVLCTAPWERHSLSLSFCLKLQLACYRQHPVPKLMHWRAEGKVSKYPHAEGIPPQMHFYFSLLFVNTVPWNEVGIGMEEPCSQVPECLASFCHGASCSASPIYITARHPWTLPLQEWDQWLILWNTELFLSAMVGAQNLTVLLPRSKYFRRNLVFISFMCILKLILTTSVLLLASCPPPLFNETLITKLNRSTSQSSQSLPNFWLQNAVSWSVSLSCLFSLALALCYHS